MRLIDTNSGFLALGHCFEGSLAVKILSFKDEIIDQAWFDNLLENALERRKDIGLPSMRTNSFRLAHAEGDGLAGLIIDVYAGVAVVQPHSVGMEICLPEITAALLKLGFERIVHKPIDKSKPSILAGEVNGLVEVLENESLFLVDVIKGQKTGFFLDQRDNRALLAQYSGW